MNIVVLDGFTLNPGDLSWDALRALGTCQIYDRSPQSEVVPRALEAEVVLTNKTVISRQHLQQLPELKYIGVLATGFNIVDVAAARDRNIPVANVPTYGTRSVAQMTFALLLELTQHVGHHAQTVRDGRWSQCPDFSYWDYPLIELDGLTMGIVGFGRIGRAVAELAAAFGMKTLAHSRTLANDPVAGASLVDLNFLLQNSDVVSLHCPLTPETKHLLNAERLALMKRGALLLNTSRGPLVDEFALTAALESGALAGAALDVLSIEPPPAGHPLQAARNCLVTPHIALATQAARRRLMQTAIANVAAFLRSELQNVVN